MTARPRRLALPVLILALALGACGRKPAGPATWAEAMGKVSEMWTLSKWKDVYAACENALPVGRADGGGRGLVALDCLAEAAARLGKPALALPHYEKLFKEGTAEAAEKGVLYRLANNYAVLLIEAGRKDEGLARLREALEAAPGDEPSATRRNTGAPRAWIVRNLARAYYDRASEPAVRTWVQEQGDAYVEYIESRRNSAATVGPGAALHELVIIGRRQANLNTPAWEEAIAAWEPKEESLATYMPAHRRACEDVPGGLQACLLEVKSPL